MPRTIQQCILMLSHPLLPRASGFTSQVEGYQPSSNAHPPRQRIYPWERLRRQQPQSSSPAPADLPNTTSVTIRWCGLIPRASGFTLPRQSLSRPTLAHPPRQRIYPARTLPCQGLGSSSPAPADLPQHMTRVRASGVLIPRASGFTLSCSGKGPYAGAADSSTIGSSG